MEPVPPITIRRATETDIPRILTLERQCATAGHWSEAQYRQATAQTERDVPRLVLLAEIDDPAIQEFEVNTPILSPTARQGWGNQHDRSEQGNPGGFLVARPVGSEWELENIVVDPAKQRQGIGRRLLETLLTQAREVGGEAVFLEVRESNTAARKLYEHTGFQPIGRSRGYYADPPEDAILYRHNLP